MGNRIDKAKIASKSALAGESEGLFHYAKYWWAIAAIRWEQAGIQKNVEMSKSRERYCSTMAIDEEDEE